MKLTAFTLLCCSFACAGELPDAPHLKMRSPAKTYSPDERMIVHNSPAASAKSSRNLDWQFLAAHGMYAGALTFDLLETSRGVSNGCEEASQALGPHPGTGRIVGYGIGEFAVVTAMDYGLRRWGQHIDSPQWMQRALGTLGASIGTFKHARGGYKWTRTGCL